MTDAPPSRYKVVEKDGRLVVIDNGEPLEPLVKHTHNVVTPAKRRSREERTQRTSRQMEPSTGTDGATISLPIGPDGESQPVPLDGKTVQRIGWSVIMVIVALFIGGPIAFFVFFVVIATAAFHKPGAESPGKKLFRAWARWVAHA